MALHPTKQADAAEGPCLLATFHLAPQLRVRTLRQAADPDRRGPAAGVTGKTWTHTARSGTHSSHPFSGLLETQNDGSGS
jgi:hypothetical protein